jgi:hypothetical protein
MPASAPGGQVEFRRTLCASFLFKMYLHVRQEMVDAGVAVSPDMVLTRDVVSAVRNLLLLFLFFFSRQMSVDFLLSRQVRGCWGLCMLLLLLLLLLCVCLYVCVFSSLDKCVLFIGWHRAFVFVCVCVPHPFHLQVRTEPRPLSHGSQEYQETPQQLQPVGQSIVHQSARLQVTGEAKYLDDMPMPVNGYHAVVVLSTKPHARLTAVDATAALQAPGAVAFISAKDLPAGGSNVQGDVIHDEELFVLPLLLLLLLLFLLSAIGCVFSCTTRINECVDVCCGGGERTVGESFDTPV